MKYRKKSAPIEAIKFTDDDYGTLVSIGSMGLNLNGKIHHYPTRIEIDTFEGCMIANIGDYIVKDINGEFYPCKPEIFEKDYEKL